MYTAVPGRIPALLTVIIFIYCILHILLGFSLEVFNHAAVIHISPYMLSRTFKAAVPNILAPETSAPMKI